MTDPNIWFQVSNRHHLVAKLPDGMNGRQALADVSDDYDVDAMGEAHAGDQFLRVYAGHVPLTREEWAAFKAAGGTTYLGAKWKSTMDIHVLKRLVKEARDAADLLPGATRVRDHLHEAQRWLKLL